MNALTVLKISLQATIVSECEEAILQRSQVTKHGNAIITPKMVERLSANQKITFWELMTSFVSCFEMKVAMASEGLDIFGYDNAGGIEPMEFDRDIKLLQDMRPPRHPTTTYIDDFPDRVRGNKAGEFVAHALAIGIFAAWTAFVALA